MNSFPMGLISIFIFLAFLVMLIVAIVLAARGGNNLMNKHDAKYVFYYLLSLAALVFTTFSVGMVLFSIINKTIPDALANYYGSNVDGSLKFAISALLIAAPIFYFISNLIAKGLKSGELEKDSVIRRWLTYFILLVSSLIILGVFISVINSFLSGELSSRFILKAVSVLILSALPFSYYFYDIKREDPTQTDSVVRIFFYGTLALVLAAFIAAWFFVESPRSARNRLLDQRLFQNMNNIEGTINSYYEKYGKLPESLEIMQADQSLYLEKKALKDPESGAAIEYRRNGEADFTLCATFRTSSLEQDRETEIYSESTGREHGAGYQCLAGNLYVNLKKDNALVNEALPAATIPAESVIK